MHKSDLIKSVADATGVSQKDAEAVINASFDAIVKAVAGGEKVVLTGFATFERKTRASRQGRHPSTGAVIDIPAKNAVGFTPGKNFKAAVEG